MELLLPELIQMQWWLFYFSWQFWLPRPHLPGASDRGAQRERHHGRLTAWKWQTLPRHCRIFPNVLEVDVTQLQVVLWDCPSLIGWPKTRPSADRCLMLQQSPHHSTSCSSVCSFVPPEFILIQCSIWKKILWVQCILVLHSPLPVTVGNRTDIWCTYLRASWRVGIHGTYILFRKSKFNVMKTAYVILMFISALGFFSFFLTSTHSLFYLPRNVCWVSL